MNGNDSHPAIINWEGAYIRNRLKRPWAFQVIEAPRERVYMHICKHRTAPPCLGEALRRGALIKL